MSDRPLSRIRRYMVACSTCAGAGDDEGNRSEDCDPAKNRNGACEARRRND
jgi:hypothetical protein